MGESRIRRLARKLANVAVGPNRASHLAMLAFQFLVFDRPRGLRLGRVGNYFLDTDRVAEGDRVYSFGIANHIAFDEAVFELTGAPVYCFDPTPQSVEFMRQFAGDGRFEFIPKGINDQPGRFKFYQSEDAKKINSSLFDIHHAGKFVWVECDTLAGFMAMLGHESVDILKLDVEGVAVRSLNRMLDDGIRPKQIVAEFEIINVGPLISTLASIHRLVKRLRRHGYKAYPVHLFRKATVEAIFVAD